MKRIGQSILTIFSVITISFILIRVMPGGPADALVARLIRQGYDSQQIQRMVQLYLEISPSKPLFEAYIDYMVSTVHGDFGKSISFGRPVIEIVASALPWTLFYASISLFISFIVGITSGIFLAYYEGSKFDVGGSIFATVINSIPYYVFAIVALAILGYQLGWFPTSGRVNSTAYPGFNIPFLLSVLHHAALPIATSAFMSFGGFALGMRGNSISVLEEDYLRVGRLRGLSSNRLALRYVGRNAILPLYTRLMLALGGVFGGSVILESIFRYTGIGYYLFQAIKARDYPLMMGAFILISVAIVTGLLIADLTYSKLDPRASQTSSADINGSNRSSSSFVDTLRRTIAYVSAYLSRNSDPVNRMENGSDIDSISQSNPNTSPITNKTNSSRSKYKKYERMIDEHVYAPAKIVWNDWRSRIGILILSFYIFMGTIGVLIVDSTQIQGAPSLIPPLQTMEHPLGTDIYGQDLLSLIVHATPAMLKMLLAGAIFATILGVIMGTLAGYLQGSVIDQLLMTVADIVVTIPGLPLVMVLAVLVSPENPYLVGILLSITSWAGLGRTLRSEVLKNRSEDYVEASELMGLTTPTIIMKNIIPNIMPYILISFVNASRRVIFGSVSLYFLGILPFSNLNWGVIMNQAYKSGALISFDMFYWLMIPMATIVLLSLGLILTAHSMDRLFNPRIRARHTKQNQDELDQDELERLSENQTG